MKDFLLWDSFSSELQISRGRFAEKLCQKVCSTCSTIIFLSFDQSSLPFLSWFIKFPVKESTETKIGE